jgi:putative ABC transport system permease protein
LAAGRNFKTTESGDSRRVILNETAARLFGWTPEAAVGNNIIYTGDNIGALEIIGVVKDFHFESLRYSIRPLVFLNSNAPVWGDQRVLSVKYGSVEVKQLLELLISGWGKKTADTPFEYSFLQQEWEQMYESENRMGRLFSGFTGLSIVVALIGLIGLVSYSVEQRRKEIGIRKVLGASATKIIIMMNRSYIKLIIIALLIACPAAWLALDQWLSVYVYRVNISPWLFVMAGATICVLALCSVGYLSLRAATLNPSEVLKDE